MPLASPTHEITRSTDPTLVKAIYAIFVRGPVAHPPEPWLVVWSERTAPGLTALERLADEWAGRAPDFLYGVNAFAADHAEMWPSDHADDAAIFGARDIADLAVWRAENPLPGESWADSRRRRDAR